MSKYRVFISYSHKDRQAVKRIARILKKNKMDPMWDDKFVGSTGFHDQIKTFISHAHVFLPLITAKTNEKGMSWANQEIGYATAMNMPVLPVMKGNPPKGFIEMLHAVKYDDIEDYLTLDAIELIVDQATKDKPPLFECAHDTTKRAILMTEYADKVRTMKKSGTVRQKGGLTSFNIPNKNIKHSDWGKRFKYPSNGFYRESLLKERRALEKHASVKGCKIILYPFTNEFKKYTKPAKIVRLKTVLDFLNKEYSKISVLLSDQKKSDESLTILGDFFLAESVSKKQDKGFQQTIFTRHAPSIHSRIEEFDEEFDSLLKEQKISLKSSKKVAIEKIKKMLLELERKPEKTSVRKLNKKKIKTKAVKKKTAMKKTGKSN